VYIVVVVRQHLFQDWVVADRPDELAHVLSTLDLDLKQTGDVHSLPIVMLAQHKLLLGSILPNRRAQEVRGLSLRLVI
jgi:hypothetical protein